MKKRILITIGILLLIIVAGFGYLVYKDLQQEEVLKQEVIKITNKDLLKDNFDISIKTTGDYAYVENAIKKFYKELSDSVKSLNYALDNKDLINILSLENLEKDKPNFTNSRQTLSKVKTTSTSSLEKIAKLCEEEYIKNLLDKEKVDDYYIKFYKELMYTEQDIKTLKETKEEMEKLSTDLNLFLDKIEELLNMLQKNSNLWYIKDNQLYFETNELVDEYNNLYTEIRKIATEKFDSSEYDNSKDVDTSI